jgi:uncharacterized protein
MYASGPCLLQISKHGVDFQEAATVFTDPLSVTFPGEDHSEDERRFLAIGESTKGEVLVAAHTEEYDFASMQAE